MKRRRLLLAALVLLLVATFFLPPVYWRVVGRVNGEAFYQGRPTSWWEREVEAYSPKYTCADRYDYGWERKAASPWYEFLLPKSPRPAATKAKLPLTDRDVAALPVLLEMLQSKQGRGW